MMRRTAMNNEIITGDVRETLPELPASSVHMCMTSPPYFGLRDYGDDEQIGLEESLDEYITELVGVGDALRQVLRDDGSWWLNLGDSYGDNKQKMLVPHRVAIALQEAGWVVRNDVTWVKPNPMPQSVKDRLNTTTEQIFHLTPQPDYWYDLDAIREPHDHSRRDTYEAQGEYGEKHAVTSSGRGGNHPSGKNPGDVFKITTKPFSDAHFAVYPKELTEKPIKATVPPKVCVDCGSPYERKTEKTGEFVTTQRGERGDIASMDNHGSNRDDGKVGTQVREFKGWNATCDCDTDDTEPGIVLDPFAGAGTTLLKAKELGRRFVGIELNPEYADMARSRVGLDVDDPSRFRDDDAQQGFEAYQ
ncbi:hypothetical protein OSG_eHP36_00170 [environmental Halophage eHP-36]|nr:hypothetical protein OSG_eHP36_00170 [environmental Halophage eHP-36]